MNGNFAKGAYLAV